MAGREGWANACLGGGAAGCCGGGRQLAGGGGGCWLARGRGRLLFVRGRLMAGRWGRWQAGKGGCRLAGDAAWRAGKAPGGGCGRWLAAARWGRLLYFLLCSMVTFYTQLGQVREHECGEAHLTRALDDVLFYRLRQPPPLCQKAAAPPASQLSPPPPAINRPPQPAVAQPPQSASSRTPRQPAAAPHPSKQRPPPAANSRRAPGHQPDC